MAKRQKEKISLRQRWRLWIQICFTALSNGYVAGFIQGKVYTGPMKMACFPGLNCYACPGALGSCPVGGLQNRLTGLQIKPPIYIIGFLLLFGSLLGRAVCGFLCPIGLLQDLIHKIPISRKYKHKTLPGHNKLRWTKFAVLLIFVVILPILVRDANGLGAPWYCKYICPSGTILGGWPLTALNDGLRQVVGFLFSWKTLLAVGLIVSSLFVFRPFCKYVCPLGAIYGLFNRFSLVRLHINQDACIQCGACTKACPQAIDVVNHPNSIECIRCGQCRDACPTGAVELTIGGKVMGKNHCSNKQTEANPK